MIASCMENALRSPESNAQHLMTPKWVQGEQPWEKITSSVSNLPPPSHLSKSVRTSR